MIRKEHQILLVEPPFFRLYDIDASLNKLPLALGYLAGMIISKKSNWRVKIYNGDFSPTDHTFDYEYLTGKGFENFRTNLHEPRSLIWGEIASTIDKVSPSVVGITTKSQNYASACNIARIVKSLCEDVLVIFGGPHVTLIKSMVLNNADIDIGVIGEGEETLVEILDVLDKNGSLSVVKGIVYRDADRIVETPPREHISDLDSLPFPVSVAKNCLIDFEKYPLQAFKHIFAIRGCPFACTFCGSRYTWTRKVRFRSVRNIIEEIHEIRRIGVNYIHFDDDTWGIKKSFIKDLCDAIRKHCPKLHWSCEVHVKFIDEETIVLMKSAGCRSIQIGVESGNNKMLKILNKQTKIEDIFAAAKLIKKHGIYLQTYFIVGFPQETESSLEETISTMTSIPTDWLIYSIFTPYFGTELFEYCKANGIISDDFDVSLINHQSPENYFCPCIPKDVFKDRIRELEKRVDRINHWKRLKMYLSKEGYLKFKERGLRRSVSRFKHLCQRMIN